MSSVSCQFYLDTCLLNLKTTFHTKSEALCQTFVLVAGPFSLPPVPLCVHYVLQWVNILDVFSAVSPDSFHILVVRNFGGLSSVYTGRTVAFFFVVHCIAVHLISHEKKGAAFRGEGNKLSVRALSYELLPRR